MAIRARPKPRPDVALHHDIKFSFARQISERRVTDRAAEASRVMFILSFRCWDCLNVICAARHMSVGRFESWAPGSSLLKLVPLPRSEITCYCFAPALHCSAVLANCQYGLTTKARPHRVITYLEVLAKFFSSATDTDVVFKWNLATTLPSWRIAKWSLSEPGILWWNSFPPLSSLMSENKKKTVS